nr:hypothetical protein [Tanacetum cinerariifolium]
MVCNFYLPTSLGWYAVERRWVTPYFDITLENLSLQKWVPLSLMIAFEVPNRENNDFKFFTTTRASLVGTALASTHFDNGTINPTTASQIALDNALVPPETRLKIGICNRRIEFSKPQREATYQITLDALKLSPCYPTFLITANLDNKKFKGYAEVLCDILQICPKLPNQPFDIPPFTDEKIMSFIYEPGYTRNIETLPELVVDHMHQPWRTFAAFINKCISRKITGLDKLRFTKIIINHFISQNKSISMRNMINLHTARDDSLLGTLKYVSKTKERQVYGALIPKEMINEEIMNFIAYQTYFAYASDAKEPMKARKFKKPIYPTLKTVPVSPKEPTKKPATKPKPTKKKGPVKADRGKGVPNEQHHKVSSTDEGTDTKLGVLDVPKYDFESEKESWGDSGEEDVDDQDDYEDKSDDDNDVNDDNDDDKNDDDDEADSYRTESSTKYNEEEKELELELTEVGCLWCLGAPYPWSSLLVLVGPHLVVGLEIVHVNIVGVCVCFELAMRNRILMSWCLQFAKVRKNLREKKKEEEHSCLLLNR